MKWIARLSILVIACTMPAFCQDQSQPQVSDAKPSIEVSFQLDGEPVLCQHSGVQLRMDGKNIAVEQLANGFTIPDIFLNIADTPKLAEKQKVDIHITCDNYVLDFTGESAAHIAQGKWETGIHTPLTWLNDNAERASIEKGFWVTYAGWACDKCNPVVMSEVPHKDIPQVFVDNLHKEQLAAQGARAMDVAYALAVFHPEDKRNRDSLLKLLRTCMSTEDVSSMTGICDQPILVNYLTNLYWRGDNGLLTPLTDAANSRAEVVEDIGVFYADLLKRKPEIALEVLHSLSEDKQHAFCKDAGRDEFRFDTYALEKVSKGMLTHEDSVAQQCIEDARKGISR